MYRKSALELLLNIVADVTVIIFSAEVAIERGTLYIVHVYIYYVSSLSKKSD